jgi:hypothetical protein
MIKIDTSSEILAFCLKELGGCINDQVETDTGGYSFRLLRINGGELDGYKGYIGHNPEKDVSWTLVPFGGHWGLETVPESYGTYAILKFTG